MTNATRFSTLLLGCVLSMAFTFAPTTSWSSLEKTGLSINELVNATPTNTLSATNSCETPPLPEVADITVCLGGDTEIVPVPQTGRQALPFTALWNFEGQSLAGGSDQPGAVPENASAGGGLGNVGFADGPAPGADNAYIGDSWTGGGNEYFEFCLNAPNGTMDVRNFRFDVKRSTSGPGELTVERAINGSGVYENVAPFFMIGPGSWYIVASNNSFGTGVTSICFRVVAVANASEEQGTLRLDDFVIRGDVIQSTDISFNFYDADPGAGPANLLAGPADSYDPATSPATGPQVIWITSVDGTCESAAVPVTVTVKSESTPLTNVSESGDSRCAGQANDVELTADGGVNGTGATIQWYTGPDGTGTNFASGPGPHTVSLSATTTYYVRREGDCNTTTDASVTVTIVPNSVTVDAGSDQTVYVGYAPQASATLTADVTGAVAPVSYLWSTGETTQSITVSPTDGTTYSVEVTDANGCRATDDVTVCAIDVRCKKKNHEHKILICHKPHSQAITLCVAANEVADHLNHGDELGSCGTTSDCNGSNSIQAAPLPLDAPTTIALADNKILAAPNPFTHEVQLSFRIPESGYAKLDIVNLSGQLVARPFEGELAAGLLKQVEFSGAGLPPGIYIARLHTASGIIPVKLVLSN